MDGQLVEIDALLADAVSQQPLDQRRRLSRGQHSVDHIAAVDVEDDVEVVVGPLHRTQQLGDVLRPHLIGAGGQQFGLDVGGMDSLGAPLSRTSPAARRMRYMVGTEQR
jgi:hypothetical protein